MNIVAYTPLLYGKAYLRWAVAAVAPVVGRHIILYTPRPSYGHGTTLPCPDSEEELRACVAEFDHVEWCTGEWHTESEHRGAVMPLLRQNDEILLPVDADEVWGADLEAVLGLVYNGSIAIVDGKVKKWRDRVREWRICDFIHHWRSFGWVCRDSMAPTRVIDLRPGRTGVEYISGHVHHFGYAQPVETMRYKWSCHGHQNELRQDCNWLEDKYVSWHPGIGDVHPTCVDIWNPGPFARTGLPAVLSNHPYFDLGIIP